MISSNIGRSFLKEYNKQNNTNYTAFHFFKEIFVPLFFDYPNYLMKGGNAPLQNFSITKGKYENKEDRARYIALTIEKIETSPADSSPIGFPSSDIEATTSGQVTNMNLEITPELVYYSWIGAAFGIGINGGLAIFFDHPEILMDIFNGWKVYRKVIQETPKMTGNQIETWNGQWLSNFYHNKHENIDDLLVNMNALEKKDITIRLKTQSWVKVIFGIAMQFPNSQFIGYVYNLGQTNTTLGFFPFMFYQVERPLQLYKKYFGESQYLKDAKQIEEIYSYNYGLMAACENGSIGLKAIEPLALKKYKPGKSEKSELFKFEDIQKDKITFNTYLTWVCAMINNEKLIEMARSTAGIFIEFESGSEKAKKDKVNMIRSLLDSGNKRKFIENLIPVVESCAKEQVAILNDLVTEINQMPQDNFLYFVTLIRFNYSSLKR